MKKNRWAYATTVVSLFLLAMTVCPVRSHAENGIEVIDDQAAYNQTYELCSKVRSFHDVAYRALRSFRFYWSGIKTGGANPLMPSHQTMNLYNTIGYWRALDECYGHDNDAAQYTFSLAIGLLDDLGAITDLGGWVYGGKYLLGAIGASSFVTAHPKLFASVGTALMGTSFVNAVYRISATIHRHHDRQKLASQLDNLQNHPEKLFSQLVDTERGEVDDLLRERVEELKSKLATSSLSESDRTKTERDVATLEKILETRAAEAQGDGHGEVAGGEPSVTPPLNVVEDRGIPFIRAHLIAKGKIPCEYDGAYDQWCKDRDDGSVSVACWNQQGPMRCCTGWAGSGMIPHPNTHCYPVPPQS